MEAIVLAAGKGSRMGSELPKPLLQVAGKAMLDHVLDAVRNLKGIGRAPCVVYGYGAEAMKLHLQGQAIRWAEQAEQLGTGHAVQCALKAMEDISDDANVIILYGDVPLITVGTLSALHDLHDEERGTLTLLTVKMSDPTGYGRIVRGSEGSVAAIVEEKDATPSQKEISEVNTGIMIANMGALRQHLANLRSDNAQSEYYLTDVVGLAVKSSQFVDAYCSQDPVEVSGANTPEQLIELEMDYLLRDNQSGVD
jgi:bifunctional UDP-N-acetylglucosamine pyrophosphorylase/glucosamine-1-phosphate N-acetyltransferase